MDPEKKGNENMNKLLRNAAAFMTAGLMATASFGVESFAESAKLYSSAAELNYAATVAKPTYTVKGTAGVRKIRLSTSTSGATIYYTTNGATPTTSSKKYTGGLLQITKNTKIRAIAVKGSSKSSIMTKTFQVATKYGDVTGDGTINSNDYTRLKNFLAGKTTYICKDNADCDGSGGLSSKDLTVLNQYLNGKISRLPSSAVATVKKPTATKAKIYGGMRITLKTTVSGATIYYTTNGATPTTSSTRYSSPFTLTSTKTIKAIVYKNGETSNPLTFTASVGTTSSVQSDKSTSINYNEPIEVKLSNSTSGSLIYYTLDGTDPRTSSTVKSYNGAIKLSEDTTIRAYARSKGNDDSDVTTFNYKVKGGTTISGVVWDDTYSSSYGSSYGYGSSSSSSSITSNGQKASNEPGISGIPVYIITSSTNVQDAPTRYVQRMVTDSNGAYSFTGLDAGTSYRVVFEYNYQKYRAYGNVVSGGNQATVYTSLPSLRVENNGTYAITGYNSSSYLNSINSYSSAVNSSNYITYAATGTYRGSVSNADFALISKNYGSLDLKMSVSGATNNKIAAGKTLQYSLTLTNNSPVSSTVLSDATIGVYLTNVFPDINLYQKTTTLNTNSTYINGGYRYLTFTDFIDTNGLAPGRSVNIVFDATVDINTAANTKIEACAEVTSYRFATSCYDYYSIPGNMTIGRPSQNDEASAAAVTVTGSSEVEKTMDIIKNNAYVMVGDINTQCLLVVAKNCSSLNEVSFLEMTNQGIVTYATDPQKIGDDLYIWFNVVGVNEGTTKIPIIYDNKTVYLTVTAVDSTP
ncbi:MAG TPA: hypothetical protein DDX72_03365 [Ruminococcaceae bacterium]|nr:hypothetical protein [Oscillospiraceae bacterium]